MNSLKTIQTLSKIGKILCKIAFVFAVIGFCGCIVGMISLSVGGNILKLGGVTIHGIISENLDYAEGSLIAVLIGWSFAQVRLYSQNMRSCTSKTSLPQEIRSLSRVQRSCSVSVS